MNKTENYFEALAKVNVKDKVEKKGNFNYLSWANAWALIKLKYPNAQRKVYEDQASGLNFFTDGRTAYVKVGIIVNEIEHIDYLPIMDFRNNSILIDKISSMDVNTAIQRSTAKAIAMHGLGLSLWVGEDIINQTTKTTPVVKQAVTYTLNVGDDNWDKVLKYVVANKTIGLEKIVKNLSVKYKISATVKKEISKLLTDAK
jgi:hypothetical protein|tara:strand:- start:192 stop:794 length:603 start_codon:yes stop_codon:yes gene_type:complete